jgi:hypothetical protein
VNRSRLGNAGRPIDRRLTLENGIHRPVRIEPLEDGRVRQYPFGGGEDPMPRRCSPETTIAFLRLALDQKPEDVDLDFVIELVAVLVTDVRGREEPE